MRTHIQLTEKQINALDAIAQRRNISLSELLSQTVDRIIESNQQYLWFSNEYEPIDGMALQRFLRQDG